MKFISVRALRNQSGTIQRTLADDNLTATSNGKPFALMAGIPEGGDPAELERLIREARAEWRSPASAAARGNMASIA